jgi:hypothetical protein
MISITFKPPAFEMKTMVTSTKRIFLIIFLAGAECMRAVDFASLIMITQGVWLYFPF